MVGGAVVEFNKDLSKIMEIEMEKRTSANLENKLTLVVGKRHRTSDTAHPFTRIPILAHWPRSVSVGEDGAAADPVLNAFL